MKSKKKRIQYLVGDEIPDWWKSEDFDLLVDYCRINERTANILKETSILKIEYEKDALRRIILRSDLYEPPQFDLEIPNSLRDYKYNEGEMRAVYACVDSKTKQKNYLGGHLSAGFVLPSVDFNNPWFKLAHFNNDASPFTWMPWGELELIYPYLLNFDIIYLDYSNPQSPQLLPESREITQSIGVLKDTCSISFKRHDLAFYDITTLGYEYLDHHVILNICSTSVPFFIQHIEIPESPITGKKMKFLVQINVSEEMKTDRYKVDFVDNENFKYVEFANEFIGNAALYVFLEEETKLVAYITQGT